jgi:hypothetical protein
MSIAAENKDALGSLVPVPLPIGQQIRIFERCLPPATIFLPNRKARSFRAIRLLYNFAKAIAMARRIANP